MAPSKSLDVQYAEAFNDQALGHALLHPCPTERLHPGVCGYFDEDGDWRTIVDIPLLKDGKGASIDSLKFSSLDDTPVLPPSTVMRWEPKCSNNVQYTKVKADVSAKYFPSICPFNRTI